MNKAEIKLKMMQLWKETFHDSDDYIRLVFDTYFDKSFIEYEEREGEIIASLLAIPYNFRLNIPVENTNGTEDFRELSLKAVYLCGLATRPDYRKFGIMSELMDRLNNRCFRNNIAFQFLIPADNNLRQYYLKRGYRNSGYNKYYNLKEINNRYCYFTDNEYDNRYYGKYIKQICYYDNKILYALNLIDCIRNILENRYFKNKECLNRAIINIFNGYKKLIYYSCDIIRIEHNYEDFKTVIFENVISEGAAYMFLSDETINNIFRQFTKFFSIKNNHFTENREDDILHDHLMFLETITSYLPEAIVFCSNFDDNNMTIQSMLYSSDEVKKLVISSLCSLLPLKVDNIIVTDQVLEFSERYTRSDLPGDEKQADTADSNYADCFSKTTNISSENSVGAPWKRDFSYLSADNISRDVPPIKTLNPLFSKDSMVMIRPVNLSDVSKFISSLCNDIETGKLRGLNGVSLESFQNNIYASMSQTGLPFPVYASLLLE